MILTDLLIISFLRHLLIAFGGLAGLEESIEGDDNLKVTYLLNSHCLLRYTHIFGGRTCLVPILKFVALKLSLLQL